MKKSFIFLILLSVSLTSCLKESGRDTGSIVSALTVIHASPNSPELEFVLDNQRVQTFTYAERKIDYFAAFSGVRIAKIFEANRFDNVLHQITLKLQSGKYYSVFVAGKKDSLSSLVLEDKLNPPTAGKAKIRFVHLSPDSPALDFDLSTDHSLASNLAFKGSTDFYEVDAGSYTTKIKSHTGDLINLEQEVMLEENKIYTFWVKGLLYTESEAEGLGYKLMEHEID